MKSLKSYFPDYTDEELLEEADQFIKETNTFPLVHAKEGGVIELRTLYRDFIHYLTKLK